MAAFHDVWSGTFPDVVEFFGSILLPVTLDGW